MAKIVFIGAGSGFGAATVADLLSFEALRDGEGVKPEREWLEPYWGTALDV